MLSNLKNGAFFFYLVFAFFCLFLMVRQYPNFADDPGLGWHIRNGQYVDHRKQPPRIDPFLYSKPARHWVSDQWLSDLIFFKVYEWGRWEALYKGATALFFLLFCVAGVLALKKAELPLVWGLISIILALRLSLVHFILRPVLFSIALFGLLYFFLAGRKRIKLSLEEAFVLPLIFAAWANLHPSFILGLFLLFIFCVSRSFETRSVLTLLASAFATLLNPYGFEVHETVYSLGRSSYFMNLNDEWRRLSSTSDEFSLLIAMLCVYLYNLIVNKRSPLSAFANLSFVSFALLPLVSVRFLPYMSIVSILPLAAAFDSLSSYFKFKLNLRPLKNSWTFSVCFLALAALLLYKHHGYGPSPLLYPYGCMTELNTIARKEGRPLAILAHPNLGGFITLQAAGDPGEPLLKPLLDDRNTLLGEEAYKRYFNGMRPGSDIIGYIEESLADYVIIERNTPLGSYFADKDRLNCSERFIVLKASEVKVGDRRLGT